MALRREVKNIVKLFTDIEIKVREATSNDPWGPPTSLLSEIADATNNKRALTEAMSLLWKRLADTGKNWRHVYKSLVVLEYIAKTGNESVAKQCKENIFVIKVLEEFRFVDKEGKDQGIHIRQKSQELVSLLQDEERLKDERQRALKAKRMIHKNGGCSNSNFPKNKKFSIGSKYKTKKSDDGSQSPNLQQESENSNDSGSNDGRMESEIEQGRPSNETEEELQLQVALAMSKEDMTPSPQAAATLENIASAKRDSNQSNLNTSINSPFDETDDVFPPSNLPWGPGTQAPTVDPWSSVDNSFSTQQTVASDNSTRNFMDDILSDNSTLNTMTEFSSFPHSTSATSNLLDTSPPPLDMHFQPFNSNPNSSNFLEIGAHLVDLNNIVSLSERNEAESNPFKPSSANNNPFFQEKPKVKSINELKMEAAFFAAPYTETTVTSQNNQNPFRSLMVAS